MKCSKCGHENPEDSIFCEECDWKLDETYIPEVKADRTIICYLAMIIGIACMVSTLAKANGIICIGLGAIGLIVGGYAFNIPRLTDHVNRKLLMAISALGLALSAIAFMFGIYQFA